MENNFEIFNDASERIHVIDSGMGTGKTTKIIEYINNSEPYEKFIFITPYLKECKRVIDSCPEKNFIQPNTRSGRGRKMSHFLELIRNEENIVSTHSLFSAISDEVISALRAGNYTLILDEVFNVVEKFDLFPELDDSTNKDQITKDDIDTLLDKEIISVTDDYSIKWNDQNSILRKYEPLKRLADRSLLYLVNKSLLLWSFPVEVFMDGIFNKIFILTFQFEYQLQHYYYNYFDIQYKKYWINPEEGYSVNETLSGNPHEKAWIENVKPLIEICDNKRLNKIGSFYKEVNGHIIETSLSKNWYNKNPKLIKKLGNNAVNWLRNYSSMTSSKDVMWTSFIDYQNELKSSRLSVKHFVALNARATNEYGNKHALVYLVNRYVNPFFEHFFLAKDIKINQNGYALSELMQWTWRSQVRNGKPVTLYIPSQRMRILLSDYLDGKGILL